MVKSNKVKCLRGPCSSQRFGETNIVFLKRLCATYLKMTYGVTLGELWYGKYKKLCIFEESFPEAASKEFKDYKVWVMHNKPYFVHIDTSRHAGQHTRDFVTPSWVKVNMREPKPYNYPPRADIGKKPIFWDSMLRNASAIASAIGIPSVRVDFFGFANDYAFSEVTYTHDSCKCAHAAPGALCNAGLIPDTAEKFYGYVATHPENNIDPEMITNILNK